MGTFSAELFDDLAKISFVRANLDPAVHDMDPHPDAPGFTHGDVREIEQFKNATFLLLMLRARRFMIESRQDQIKVPTERIAVSCAEFCFDDAMVHRDRTKIRFSIIPTAAIGIFDGDDPRIRELLKQFGDYFTLACKNPN